MKLGLSGLKRRIEGSHVLTGALSSDTEASTRTALVQIKQERTTNAQLLTAFYDLACVKVGNKNFGLYSLRIASNSRSAAYFYRVDTLWWKTKRTKTERSHWYDVLT
jgi:hypothetical protein